MSDPARAVFRTRRRIEFVDTDMAGIVHFSNFFRFMEAAEVDFLRDLGLSVVLEWEGQPIGFPRVSASCDYLKPARFQDVLEITVSVRRVGEKSVTYGFEFSKDSADIARGQVTCVCCRRLADHHYESMVIPPGIRAALERGKA
jgi:YbgC/YbaW family acyl-CoA thioester hydrolase